MVISALNNQIASAVIPTAPTNRGQAGHAVSFTAKLPMPKISPERLKLISDEVHKFRAALKAEDDRLPFIPISPVFAHSLLLGSPVVGTVLGMLGFQVLAILTVMATAMGAALSGQSLMGANMDAEEFAKLLKKNGYDFSERKVAIKEFLLKEKDLIGRKLLRDKTIERIAAAGEKIVKSNIHAVV